MYDEGCRTFYTGMARGFDIIAAESVLLLKKSGKPVRLFCVLPFAEQVNGFEEPWHTKYAKITDEADEVIILSDAYYKGCYAKRNTFMVDNSDYVITWFDSKKGGTENTLKYAAKKGRYIINLNIGSEEYSGFQYGFNL